MNSQRDIKSLASRGASFSEVLSTLTSQVGRPVRPLDFLRAAHENLGIPLAESREMLEYFNPSMEPIAAEESIDDRWRSILRSRSLYKDSPDGT